MADLHSPLPESVLRRGRRAKRPTRTPRTKTPFGASASVSSACRPHLSRALLSQSKRKLTFGEGDADCGEVRGQKRVRPERNLHAESLAKVTRRQRRHQDRKERHTQRKERKRVSKENEKERAAAEMLASGFGRLSIGDLESHMEQERKEKEKQKRRGRRQRTRDDVTKNREERDRRLRVKAERAERMRRKQRQHVDREIRVVRSARLFEKQHTFEDLLVEPVDNGSGCYIYKSIWNGKAAVTKLIPLFAVEGFTEEESVDNALREYNLHLDVYRTACEWYGVQDACVVPMWASVQLVHTPPIVGSSSGSSAAAGGKDRLSERRQPQLMDVDEDDIDTESESCHSDVSTESDSSSTFSSSAESASQRKFLAITMPRFKLSLRKFLKHHRSLKESEVYMLLECGVRFLSVCRALNIIHNDLKTENIFVEFAVDAALRRRRSGQPRPVRVSKFVFADFGCSSNTEEEFPYGNICGTLTMWDLEALGPQHGDEDGFSFENDFYGLIGSAFDGLLGHSPIEQLMMEEDPDYDIRDWPEYTDMLRECRALLDERSILHLLNKVQCKDQTLRQLFCQLALPRDERISAEELAKLIGVELQKQLKV